MEYKVNVDKPSNVLRKLTVTIPAQNVSEKFQAGFARAQKQAHLKGFRPGKAPISIIKKHYESDVRNQVLNQLVDDSFKEVVQKEKINAVGRPSIQAPENLKAKGNMTAADWLIDGKDFVYIATVEVMPEVKIKTYKGFSLKKEKIAVSDKDLKEYLDHLRDQNAELLPVDEKTHTLAMGDFANIFFKGGLVTDTGIEHMEGMEGDRPVELGTGELIPGFEEAMVGMKTGEEKTFQVDFPKEYHSPDVAGKPAEFYVKINEIKQKKLPEVNDDFAKTLKYENVAEMKEKVKENMAKGREQQAEQKLRGQLLEELVKKNTFEVPSSLVQARVQMLTEDFVRQLQQQRFNEEMIKTAIDNERDNIIKRAEFQVRAGLLLEKIAEEEGIHVTSEDFDKELEKMATQMNMEIDKIKQFYEQDKNRKENMEFQLREDKTVQFLLENSKVK